MPESAPVTTKAAPQSPPPAASANTQSLSGLIWSVADLLRGDYKPHDYGKVILPFTVLRRLNCVLAPPKAAVLAQPAAQGTQGPNPGTYPLRQTRVL